LLHFALVFFALPALSLSPLLPLVKELQRKIKHPNKLISFFEKKKNPFSRKGRGGKVDVFVTVIVYYTPYL